METVERQEDECRAYAAENALPIAEHHVYTDNHYSAWKKSGAIRPAWLAMMAAIERGELAGILVYKLDRFTRAPSDMETLIELAEHRGLVIRGRLAGHIDLTTANGRREARGAANQAASESDSTSERVRSAIAEIMASGKPMGGGRCFGFEVGGEIQRPAEVAMLRGWAARVLAGETLQALARELNTSGLKTVRGGRWTGSNLGRTLDGARYGGHVEHKGRIVATMPGEPIFDRDTYDGIQAIKAARRRGPRPSGRFPLTGLLTCEKCQRPMNGATGSKIRVDGSRPREYRCPIQLGGCGRAVLADPVEEIVGDHMVALMADPLNVEAIVAENEHLSDARSATLGELHKIEDRLTSLEVKWATGELIQAAYDRSKPVLDRQRAKLLDALAELAPAVAIDAYDAGVEWARLSADERRVIIRTFRVKIDILGRQAGTRRFDPNRVTFPAV